MLKYTIATATPETDILTEYGVHVSGTTGLLGRPDMKTPTKFDWSYLNGEWIDLRSRRYKPREIKMSCWLKGGSKQTAINKMNTFFKALGVDKLIRLHIDFVDTGGEMQVGTKGLFYLVYLSKQSVSKYKWRPGRQIIEFDLTLIEPSPVKRVTKVVSTYGDHTVNLSYYSGTEFDVHWGDGEVDYDLVGGTSQSPNTVSHEYKGAGTHYIIITGVIPEITASLTTSTAETTITQIYDEI